MGGPFLEVRAVDGKLKSRLEWPNVAAPIFDCCNHIISSAIFMYSLASHTLQSLRERGSGEVTYNELFCWNAIIVLNCALCGGGHVMHCTTRITYHMIRKGHLLGP